MPRVLEGAAIDSGIDAVDALADLVAPGDPDSAALLRTQLDRLLEDNPATRAAERAVLEAARARAPEPRSQFCFYAQFNEAVTTIESGGRQHVWVYDDDLVSLDTGDPRRDPWEGNTESVRQLCSLLAQPGAPPPRSLRIGVHGGASPFARGLRELGASRWVSHLSLWSQRIDPEPIDLASDLPGLLAFSGTSTELLDATPRGAPNLESVTVRSGADCGRVLKHLSEKPFPALAHLAFQQGLLDETVVDTVARSALLPRLHSLELWTVNESRAFPFERVLADRAPWSSLGRLVLPCHYAEAARLEPFRGWPEVSLVEFDRRSVVALDVALRGWGYYFR